MGQELRLPDWEPRLRAVLDRWQAVDCSREHHCGDLAAEVADAVAGRAEFRAIADARTPRQVADLFRRYDARTLSELVTALLGEPVTARQAVRGDIVQAAADPALGVCVGSRAAFLSDGGLAMIPMRLVGRAWKL